MFLVDGISTLPISEDEGGKKEGKAGGKKGGRPNPFQTFENHQSGQKLRGSELIKNRKKMP